MQHPQNSPNRQTWIPRNPMVQIQIEVLIHFEFVPEFEFLDLEIMRGVASSVEIVIND